MTQGDRKPFGFVAIPAGSAIHPDGHVVSWPAQEVEIDHPDVADVGYVDVVDGMLTAPGTTREDPPMKTTPELATTVDDAALHLRPPRVVEQPPTCAGLEKAIVQHFEYVEKVHVRDNLEVITDRLLVVVAVLKGRPAGVKPHVAIALFAHAQLDGWTPRLPPLRVLCSTYDAETGELDG